MRRHKEIIKNVVLESLLLLRFLGEQKMKASTAVENRKSMLIAIRRTVKSMFHEYRFDKWKVLAKLAQGISSTD